MTPPAPTPEQPKHRADVLVDSCSSVVNQPWRSDKVPCRDCEDNPYVGRHAAARVAEDERRAL